MIQREDAINLGVCPLERVGGSVWRVAIPPGTPDEKKNVVRGYLGTIVEFVEQSPKWINDKIEELYPRSSGMESAPEARLREIIQVARKLRAGDILFEPFGGSPKDYVEFARMDVRPRALPARVRFNIENLFYEYRDPATRLPRAFFVSEEEYTRTLRVIKSRATLSSDDERLPSDGRIAFDYDGITSEYRINFMPLVGGQKAVLRAIATSTGIRDLRALSFRDAYDPVLELLTRKGAFVLIAGPPRNGKTTAAYALLRSLPATSMNLYTVEQPVEAVLPGVSQVSIPDAEEAATRTNQITMANAIRSLVRQNPDVVLVGEMRDEETVREAFTIATSGTSVIATVHADRAHNVFERIRYLFHVQPQQVQALLSCVVAQRLVRRVCVEQACAIKLSGMQREANPDGCPACNFRGYAGEIAIVDIFEKRHGRWEYTTTMEELAERAIREGITDRAEVHRVLGKAKLEYEPAAAGLNEAETA